MTIGDIALLLTALGVGGIGNELVSKLIEQRRGKLSDEQDAWERGDVEARWRRLLQEYAHTMRRLLHVRFDVPYEDMPAPPERPTSDSRPKRKTDRQET